ncbi:MAG: hypothetical protein JWR05_1446 [Mucilaginibacter sp.]|nr:hypothetical protein [Mucilaginibacter sp.]
MIKFITKNPLIILCLFEFVLLSCNKNESIETTPPNLSITTQKTSSLLLSSTSPPSGSGFMLGVNGHLGDAPYVQLPASKQIQLLNEMKMKWYRINLQTYADGTIKSESRFLELYRAASEKGVNLLPIIYTRTLDLEKTESESYKLGWELGSNFAAKYGQYFTHYDMGNDLELKLLIKGKTGKSQNHYDKRKTNVTAAYLKGMDEGIKSKDPTAKTMISSGWVHYGFIRMCDWYGVKFDVVAYHWYSDMERLAPTAPYYIPDITVKLASLFPNKLIWFTEFNYRYKEANSNTYEAEQNAFIMQFIQKCKNNPKVQALLIYELLNEPYKRGDEGHFGLIKWVNRYTVYDKTMIANTMTIK